MELKSSDLLLVALHRADATINSITVLKWLSLLVDHGYLEKGDEAAYPPEYHLSDKAKERLDKIQDALREEARRGEIMKTKKILLVDMDSKIPNFALMLISAYWKALGHKVELTDFNGAIRKNPTDYKAAYASVMFSDTRPKVRKLLWKFPDLIVGGPGWSLEIRLPAEIEAMQPDYNLYNTPFGLDLLYRRANKDKRETGIIVATERLSAGYIFTSRGCIRNCDFCVIPKASWEGRFRQCQVNIEDYINPKSNLLYILDNNLSADPLVLDKLGEVRERNLQIKISQGVDIRLMNEPLAKSLAACNHKDNLHFAWDLMASEKSVLEGIGILSEYIKPSDMTCYVLTGFNTTFEEDLYRIRKLQSMKIRPLVMVYRDPNKENFKPQTIDQWKRKHMARWVNRFVYKTRRGRDFEKYEPWMKTQASFWAKEQTPQLSLSFAG